MLPERHVWVFIGAGGHFPGGIFTHLDGAEKWIRANQLTGVLTAYPVDEGCLDWALRMQCHNLKPEILAAKRQDPRFVGTFSTASQDHYHYENGERA